nr:hypothetical protein [uncultured Carboxylicivirga sp.]
MKIIVFILSFLGFLTVISGIFFSKTHQPIIPGLLLIVIAMSMLVIGESKKEK